MSKIQAQDKKKKIHTKCKFGSKWALLGALPVQVTGPADKTREVAPRGHELGLLYSGPNRKWGGD